MPLHAVIFDLDDTLLDTRALLPLRDQRAWADVYENLHRVSPFELPSSEPRVTSLPADLKGLGLKVGLLTHSPERYARELLTTFNIEVDAMITGSSNYPPKPDPTGLRAVMNTLGAQPEQTLYVGDSPADFAAAAAAGMASAGVAWTSEAPSAWRHSWPDVAIARPSRLLGFIQEEPGLGPWAEVCTAQETPSPHWGSVLRLGGSTLSLGRYFRTDDRRHPGHALSALVLRAKDQKDAAREVSSIFCSFADSIPVKHPPDLVCSVPPAPDEDNDRFSEIRPALAAAWGATDGGDALRMVHPVSGYKHMSHEERAAANVGRFEARNLDGGRVVLIDDVLSSGGQSDACRDALLSAGADHVTVLSLTVTQENLPEPCPTCGANLRTFTGKRDGKRFLGCSAWIITRCPYTRDL